jgi:hypothetical protein
MADAGVRDVEAFIEFQKGRALYDAAHKSVGAPQFDSLLVAANVHYERAIARAPNLWHPHLLHSDLHLHRLQNHVYGRRVDNPDAGTLALARQRAASDLAAASRFAPAPEQRAVADMHRILISDDWTGLAETVGKIVASGRCLPAFYLDRLIAFDREGAVQRLAERNVSCDPLDLDSWYIYVESLRQGSPRKALEVVDDALRRLGVRGEYLMSQKVLTHIALKQFDAAESTLRSPEFSEADRIELTVALHAARGNAGAAREAAAARSDRYGSHDMFAVIFAAWAGDAGSADAIAARIDERESGPFALLGVVVSCNCGAPFHLDATPNLKARLAEAGFAWPPATVFDWPLKNW